MTLMRYMSLGLAWMAFLACGREDSVDPVPSGPAGITLSDTSFSVVQTGEPLSLEITSPAHPHLTLPDWIGFVDGRYRMYHITVGLTVARNDSYEERSAEVTVTAEGCSPVTLTITQAGKEKPVIPDAGEWESAATAVLNMGAGWNLGNTLDSHSNSVNGMWIEAFTERKPSDYETAWGQPVTTRELIHLFKEAGFNAIRVPVTWYPHMGNVTVTTYQDANGDWKGRWDVSTWTGYDVNPAWMARVKEVVDYVMDEGMYCLLNVHHDTGADDTAWLVAGEDGFKEAEARYRALWQQIAETFKDYGEKLLFESYNEMLDPYDSWCFASYATPSRYDAAVAQSAYSGINSYAKAFVETVRESGGNNAGRNLVVNTYGACSGDGTWNQHLKEPLDQFLLPEEPGHIAVEVHSYWKADQFDAQKADIDKLFTNLDEHLAKRLDVPVIIGEWGGETKDDAVNARFAGYFSRKAKEAGMAAYMWMSLSDGKDRSVPKWTMPKTKDAILEPYLNN